MHTLDWPLRQYSQVPSPWLNGTTTRWPFLKLRTSLPTSSTTPVNSCPRIEPGCRETHPGPVARPCVPVGTADAVGLDADDSAGGCAFGIGNGFNDERLFGRFEYCCFHFCLLLVYE